MSTSRGQWRFVYSADSRSIGMVELDADGLWYAVVGGLHRAGGFADEAAAADFVRRVSAASDLRAAGT